MTDIDQIPPGTPLHIRVTKRPTNEAAVKTIRRVLNKDPEHKRENKRLKDVRKANLRYKTRGGRPWAIRLPRLEPVKAEPGEQGTVQGSLDVLRDLSSVARFVEVSPAN